MVKDLNKHRGTLFSNRVKINVNKDKLMETRKDGLQNDDKTPSTYIVNNSLQEQKQEFDKSHRPKKPHVWTEDDNRRFAEPEKDSYFDGHNIRDIDGRCAHLCKGDPDYREHPSGSYVMGEIGLSLRQFNIDICHCNVIEHTLLALAGVKEMPLKRCVVFDPALEGRETLAQLDELERKKVEESSIFFRIPLSNKNAMELLQKFAVEKGIEFNDYTHTLSKEDKQSNIKLICLNAESVHRKLLPDIIEYLKSHSEEVKRHRKVMYENLSVKHQESSGSCSWGRLFNKRTALAALTVTVSAAAAAAAMTFANRR